MLTTVHYDLTALRYQHEETHYTTAMTTDNEISSLVSQPHSSSCKLFTVVADGIIGTSLRNDLCEMERLPSASCLLLPRMMDIDVFTFKYTLLNSNDEADNEINDQQAVQNSCGIDAATLIPAQPEDVKLILWFLENVYNVEEKSLGLKMLKQYNKAVIAGGYVDSFAVSPAEKQKLQESR